MKKMKKLPMEQKRRFVNLLKEVEIIKYGNFILKDGSESSVYIDLRILPNFPAIFKEIIKITAQYFIQTRLVETFDGIITPPLAGIPLGVALAQELNKAFYLAREKPKNHGQRKLIEGEIASKRILVIDDVITSGSSKIGIFEAIKEHNGQLVGLFVFINRMTSPKRLDEILKEYGIQFFSLLSLNDLLLQE